MCTTSRILFALQDNEEGYDIVPGSDIVITRTADTENTSKYYLDGKGSTFSEVGVKLRTKGVDLDNNRFLILQGEVEQIAMMKPKSPSPHETGLLEYLEDIIGSNKYVEAIDEGFTQVESLNEVRQEKLNRVKLVEKEKDSLEGAKSEAEEFLTKENELNVITASMHQVFQYESERNAEVATKQKAELETQLTYERKKLGETTEKLTLQETEYSEKKRQFDEIVDELARTKADFSAFERKDIKYREDMKHEKAQKKKFKTKAKKLEEDVAKLQERLAQIVKDCPELESKLEGLTKDKAEAEAKLEEAMDSFKGKTEPLRNALEAQQKELIPLKNVLNEFQQNVSVCEAELNIFDEKTSKAASQYESVKGQLDSFDGRVKEKADEVQKMEQSVGKQDARHNEAKDELAEAEQQEQTLNTQRQTLRNTLAECKDAVSSSSSRGQMLTNLLKEKKKGRLNGLHGRLGELGTIDAKYDVAITTACPALNNLVVDDVLTGSKCIEYVRQQKLGRVTCIMLDKIAHLASRAEGSIQTPEGVPRLYDLIKPKDPKFRTAFYKAIGDTLVAETLDQASRIAYGKERRWRVVTLDGQLIDTTGTMSGGGNQVRKGGMSSKASNDSEFSTQDATKYQGLLDKCETELANVRDHIKELQQELKVLKAGMSKATVELKKASLGLESLRGGKSQLQTRLVDLRGSLELTEADKKRIATLKADLIAQSKKLTEAKKGTTALEAGIAELEKKIMAAGGDVVRGHRVKVEQMAKKVDETTKEITKMTVELASGSKKVTKMEKELLETETAVTTSEQTLETLLAEFKQIEDGAMEVLAAFRAAQKEQESKGKELEAIQKEYEVSKKIVESIRGVEVDICNRVEDYDRTVADNVNKAKHWAKKLVGIQKKIRQSEQFFVSQEAPVEEEAKEGLEGIAEEEEDEGDAETPTTDKGGKYQPLTQEEVAALKKEDLQYQITMLEESLKLMKPNMKAIAEYRKKEQEYAQRVEQLDQTTQERDAARKGYDALRKKRLDEFMEGFSTITLKLKEMYQMLTLGGDAELELVDSLDPFSEGIVFSVRPPKKSWKNIQNLSGGEKTLSSLALVFALHHFKPTPLYVMDEIDAALDFKNVSIVGNYIKERTKDAQFIIISLRNNMFELADRLVGIYKTDNATKSISIDPRKFVMPQPLEEAHTETSG
jgi:structural maintenance of chromosome 4